MRYLSISTKQWRQGSVSMTLNNNGSFYSFLLWFLFRLISIVCSFPTFLRLIWGFICKLFAISQCRHAGLLYALLYKLFKCIFLLIWWCLSQKCDKEPSECWDYTIRINSVAHFLSVTYRLFMFFYSFFHYLFTSYATHSFSWLPYFIFSTSPFLLQSYIYFPLYSFLPFFLPCLLLTSICCFKFIFYPSQSNGSLSLVSLRFNLILFLTFLSIISIVL